MSKSFFKDWTLTKLDKRFGLKQIRMLPELEEWLSAESDLSEFERMSLLAMQESAILQVDSWNEQEYSLNFIGPLLLLVNFVDEEFNAFAQRYFSGVVDGEEMHGYPDGIIAQGRREPEVPYFCLQEYKREKDPEGDPAGQCMAAMLVAQELNQNQQPIYGSYVAGRNWFFMTLRDKEYAISNSYTITHEQIFDIFRVLKTLKKKIVANLKNSKVTE